MNFKVVFVTLGFFACASNSAVASIAPDDVKTSYTEIVKPTFSVDLKEVEFVLDGSILGVVGVHRLCACGVGGNGGFGDHTGLGSMAGEAAGAAGGAVLGAEMGPAGSALMGWSASKVGNEVGYHLTDKETYRAYDEANKAHLKATGKPLLGPGNKAAE